MSACAVFSYLGWSDHIDRRYVNYCCLNDCYVDYSHLDYYNAHQHLYTHLYIHRKCHFDFDGDDHLHVYRHHHCRSNSNRRPKWASEQRLLLLHGETLG